MPFMKGPAPVRRTAQYLLSGCGLSLREQVKVFTVNYNTSESDPRHRGAKDFVFWRLPQIQYANPDVQVATFKNMTPTPFVRVFMADRRQMLIDVEGVSADDILAHLIRVVGKPANVLAAEALAKEKKDNPANFGVGCERPCICEVRGQVPCSGVVPIPLILRGKNYAVKMELQKQGKLPRHC